MSITRLIIIELKKLNFVTISIKKIACVTLGISTSLYMSIINALPSGGSVVDGQAGIVTDNSYMQINQSTNSALINWQTFNIGSSEHVHFNQPGVNSLTINRINPANGASGIYGTLTATGQIFLLNPAGVIFGNGATVDVAGILASTSDINLDAYYQGRYEFVPNFNYNGSIINNGNISIKDSGYAAFVAPTVINNGVISANLGHVQLSSGDAFTVDLYGDQLINFKLPADKAAQLNRKYKVENNGQIYADGGRILMTSADVDDVVSSVINMNGLAQANTIYEKNGSIVFSSGKSGKLTFGNNAKVKASEGYVKARAKDITLSNGSEINVSSENNNGNGGAVSIGGNFQGKIKDGNDYNATTVTIENDASIFANANQIGNGGEIIIWSDSDTSLAGSLLANSGVISGNGGFIETSSKGKLNLLSGIEVQAASISGLGLNGLWLLDPPADTVTDIEAGAFSATLSGGTDVTIQVTTATTSPNKDLGTLQFDNTLTPIQWSSDADFFVEADYRIIFTDQNQIISNGLGNISLRSGMNPNPTGGWSDNLSLGSIMAADSIGANASVVSDGGGLVEIYIRPQVLGELDNNTNELGFNSNSNNIYSTTGGSQFIEYHYIDYNDPVSANRKLSDAATAVAAAGAGFNEHIGFALVDNVDLDDQDSIFMGFDVFRGHFDGQGYTLSDFDLTGVNSVNGHAGLFHTTNTIQTTGSQYIKNIGIDNFNVEYTADLLNPNDVYGGGALIGQANLSNTNPLNIQNITVDNSNILALTYNSGGVDYPFRSSAGLLIGRTDGIGTLNIENIYTGSSGSNFVDSFFMGSHVLGETNADNIVINNINIGSLDLDPDINVMIDNDINNITPESNFQNGITESFYLGGVIGRTTNPNLILTSTGGSHAIRVGDTDFGVQVTEVLNFEIYNLFPDQSVFAGGVFGDFVGQSLTFNNNVDIWKVFIDSAMSETGESVDFGNKGLYIGGVAGRIQRDTDLNNIDTIDVTFNDINIDQSHLYGLLSSTDNDTIIADNNIGGVAGSIIVDNFNLGNLYAHMHMKLNVNGMELLDGTSSNIAGGFANILANNINMNGGIFIDIKSTGTALRNYGGDQWVGITQSLVNNSITDNTAEINIKTAGFIANVNADTLNGLDTIRNSTVTIFNFDSGQVIDPALLNIHVSNLFAKADIDQIDLQNLEARHTPTVQAETGTFLRFSHETSSTASVGTGGIENLYVSNIFGELLSQDVSIGNILNAGNTIINERDYNEYTTAETKNYYFGGIIAKADIDNNLIFNGTVNVSDDSGFGPFGGSGYISSLTSNILSDNNVNTLVNMNSFVSPGIANIVDSNLGDLVLSFDAPVNIVSDVTNNISTGFDFNELDVYSGFLVGHANVSELNIDSFNANLILATSPTTTTTVNGSLNVSIDDVALSNTSGSASVFTGGMAGQIITNTFTSGSITNLMSLSTSISTNKVVQPSSLNVFSGTIIGQAIVSDTFEVTGIIDLSENFFNNPLNNEVTLNFNDSSTLIPGGVENIFAGHVAGYISALDVDFSDIIIDDDVTTNVNNVLVTVADNSNYNTPESKNYYVGGIFGQAKINNSLDFNGPIDILDNPMFRIQLTSNTDQTTLINYNSFNSAIIGELTDNGSNNLVVDFHGTVSTDVDVYNVIGDGYYNDSDDWDYNNNNSGFNFTSLNTHNGIIFGKAKAASISIADYIGLGGSLLAQYLTIVQGAGFNDLDDFLNYLNFIDGEGPHLSFEDLINYHNVTNITTFEDFVNNPYNYINQFTVATQLYGIEVTDTNSEFNIYNGGLAGLIEADNIDFGSILQSEVTRVVLTTDKVVQPGILNIYNGTIIGQAKISNSFGVTDTISLESSIFNEIFLSFNDSSTLLNGGGIENVFAGHVAGQISALEVNLDDIEFSNPIYLTVVDDSYYDNAETKNYFVGGIFGQAQIDTSLDFYGIVDIFDNPMFRTQITSNTDVSTLLNFNSYTSAIIGDLSDNGSSNLSVTFHDEIYANVDVYTVLGDGYYNDSDDWDYNNNNSGFNFTSLNTHNGIIFGKAKANSLSVFNYTGTAVGDGPLGGGGFTDYLAVVQAAGFTDLDDYIDFVNNDGIISFYTGQLTTFSEFIDYLGNEFGQSNVNFFADVVNDPYTYFPGFTIATTLYGIELSDTNSDINIYNGGLAGLLEVDNVNFGSILQSEVTRVILATDKVVQPNTLNIYNGTVFGRADISNILDISGSLSLEPSILNEVYLNFDNNNLITNTGVENVFAGHVAGYISAQEIRLNALSLSNPIFLTTRDYSNYDVPETKNYYIGGVFGYTDETAGDIFFNAPITIDVTNSNDYLFDIEARNSNLYTYLGGVIGQSNHDSTIFNSVLDSNFTLTINNNYSSVAGTYIGKSGFGDMSIYTGGLIGQDNSNTIEFNGILNVNAAFFNEIYDNNMTTSNNVNLFSGSLIGESNTRDNIVLTSLTNDYNYIAGAANYFSANEPIDNSSLSELNVYSAGLFGRINSSGLNLSLNGDIEVDYEPWGNWWGDPRLNQLETYNHNINSFAGGIFGSVVANSILFNGQVNVYGPGLYTEIYSDNIPAGSVNSYLGGVAGMINAGDLIFNNDVIIDNGLDNFVGSNNDDTLHDEINVYLGGIAGRLELQPSTLTSTSGSVIFNSAIDLSNAYLDDDYGTLEMNNTNILNWYVGTVFGYEDARIVEYNGDVEVTDWYNYAYPMGFTGVSNIFFGGISGLTKSDSITYADNINIDLQGVGGDYDNGNTDDIINQGPRNIYFHLGGMYGATDNTLQTITVNSPISVGNVDNYYYGNTGVSFDDGELVYKTGGLIGELNSNTITFSDINFDGYLYLQTPGARIYNSADNNNNEFYLGGVIGYTNQNMNSVFFDGFVDINITNNGETSFFELENANVQSFLGGVFGQANHANTVFNEEIIINNLSNANELWTEIINDGSGSVASYVGGIAGASYGGSVTFDNLVNIVTDFGNYHENNLASDDSNVEIYIGSLYGLLNTNNGSFAINSNFSLDNTVNADIYNNDFNTVNTINNYKIAAGGIIGEYSGDSLQFASIDLDGSRVRDGIYDEFDYQQPAMASLYFSNLIGKANVSNSVIFNGDIISDYAELNPEINSTADNTTATLINSKFYVGGLFGQLIGAPDVTFNSFIELGLDIDAYGGDGVTSAGHNSYVGGMFGYAELNDLIFADYVDLGFNGDNYIYQDANFIKTNDTPDNINMFTGSMAGAIIANSIDFQGDLYLDYEKVNSDVQGINDGPVNTFEFNVYAGGLYGQANITNSLVFNSLVYLYTNLDIDQETLSSDLVTTEGVENFYIGGLIGDLTASEVQLNYIDILDTDDVNIVLDVSDEADYNTFEIKNIYLGGLFGRIASSDLINFNQDLNLTFGEISLQLSALGNTAINSYVGGLFGLTNAATINFDGVTSIDTDSGIFTEIYDENNSANLDLNTFVGGIAGDINGDNLVFMDDVTINNGVGNDIENNNTDTSYNNINLYVGNIAGRVNLTNDLTFNGLLDLSNTGYDYYNGSIEPSTFENLNYYAGQAFGFEDVTNVMFNGDIYNDYSYLYTYLLTNGDQANVYYGGLSGLTMSDNITFANGTFIILDGVGGDVDESRSNLSGVNIINFNLGGMYGATDNPNQIITVNADIEVNNIVESYSYVNSSILTNDGGLHYHVGGLIGRLNSSSIDLGNVEFNAELYLYTDGTRVYSDPVNNTNELYLGGLFGQATSNVNNINFNGSVNINIANAGQPVIDFSTVDANLDVYAGGIFGYNNSLNTTFNDNVVISDIGTGEFAVNVDNTFGGDQNVYTGGISGADNVSSLTFNGLVDIQVDITSSVNNSDANTDVDIVSYTGGISGYTTAADVLFDNDVTVASVTSTVDLTHEGGDMVNSTVYTGGLFGVSNITSPLSQHLDNGTINIGNTGGGSVIESNNFTNATGGLYTGGLFGLLNGAAGITYITSDININADISSYQDNTLDILSVTDKFTTGIYSGGLIGLQSAGLNVIYNNVVVDGNVNATSGGTSGEAVQAAGGIYGGLVNSSFFYDNTTFNFMNNGTTSSSSGFEGGVIGYIDVDELNPTVASGVINGELLYDSPNDGADWASGAGLFAYFNTDPCQGPSADLCNAVPATIPNPTTIANYLATLLPSQTLILPDNLINNLGFDLTTIEVISLTTACDQMGEALGSACLAKIFGNISDLDVYISIYKTITSGNDVVILGYPGTTYTAADGKIDLSKFTLKRYDGELGNNHQSGSYYVLTPITPRSNN